MCDIPIPKELKDIMGYWGTICPHVVPYNTQWEQKKCPKCGRMFSYKIGQGVPIPNECNECAGIVELPLGYKPIEVWYSTRTTDTTQR